MINKNENIKNASLIFKNSFLITIWNVLTKSFDSVRKKAVFSSTLFAPREILKICFYFECLILSFRLETLIFFIFLFWMSHRMIIVTLLFQYKFSIMRFKWVRPVFYLFSISLDFNFFETEFFEFIILLNCKFEKKLN